MELKENKILIYIQKLYRKYIPKYSEACTKHSIIKMFFENRFIDMCDYNIFLLNYYLNELSPEDDAITYEQLIRLVFFIYEQQLIYINKKAFLNEKKKRVKREARATIMSVDRSSIDALLASELSKEFNILQFIMNGKSIKKREKRSMDLDQKIQLEIDKKNLLITYCYPNFEKNQDILKHLLRSEIIEFISQYETHLYKVFSNYGFVEDEKNISLLNISRVPDIIWDCNIFTNIKSDSVADILSKFLAPYVIDIDELLTICDDPKFRNCPDYVMDYMKNYQPEKLNLCFSDFVLFLAAIGIKLPENKGKPDIDSLENFFNNILCLQKNTYFEELARIEEEAHVEVIEFVPDSKNLDEAKRMHNNPNSDDTYMVLDYLNILDKDVPELSDNFKATCNPVFSHSNDVYYDKYKHINLKFPIIPLKVEADEKKERDEKLIEDKRIAKSKKPVKQNNRDPQRKQPDYEYMPDPVEENFKRFGRPTIESLKNRLLKNAYNDTLWNSNVYPTLIPEILLIPRQMKPEVFSINIG